uniref:Uncharacterized protein n=1 Tax=Anguilla anguilla TaxID=7936 RepID=A0A0E9ST24_ANGAN
MTNTVHHDIGWLPDFCSTAFLNSNTHKSPMFIFHFL